MENKSTFFSIVIPSYKSKDFIEGAVKSVYDNEYENFEIVICDQGETDSSFLLSEYDKVRIIRLEEPSTYNARAELIKQAKGDYILSLDCDDAFDKNTLNDLNKIICDTNYDMYIFRKKDIPEVVELEKETGDINAIDKNGAFDKIFLYCNGFYNDMLTKCFKRPENFSYEPKKLINTEDGYILLEVMESLNTFAFIDKIYYFHNNHSAGVSKRRAIDKVCNVFRYFAFMSSKVDKHYSLNTARSLLYEIYNNFYYFAKEGKFDKKLFKEYKKDEFVKKGLKVYRKRFFYYFKHLEGRAKSYLLLTVFNKYWAFNKVIKKTLKTK